MKNTVWKISGSYLLLGLIMPVFAYFSGAGLPTIVWILATLCSMLLFQIFNILWQGQADAVASNDASVAEELGHEMWLLVQQVENNTASMLGHIREELSQMRAIVQDASVLMQGCFANVHKDTMEQTAVVQKLLEDVRSALDAQSQAGVQSGENINKLLGGTIEEIEDITQLIEENINDILRSLQCEDIVRQLIESSERHLNYLVSVLATVDMGIRNLSSKQISVAEYIAGLRELREQIARIERESLPAAQKSVCQKTMDEGNVTLF